MSNINNVDLGSDSEDGEDFRPGAGKSEDEGGSDEEVAVKSRSKSASRRPSVPPDDEDDDDAGEEDQAGDGAGDEDEEEEDDDEDIINRPRKQARRDPRNQFIEDEAEVDDEDEADEEDEDEGLHGDFIARDHPDDLADLPQGAETDDRRHRELDRKRELEAQVDAEEEAARLKERYGRRQTAAQQVSQVPRRMLLPSIDDPSIWGVRCKPGKEREVIFSILKRQEDRASSKTPLPIISAFERGSTPMAGYIYVEARKQSDVLDSLDGLLNVYPRTKMVLVAIKEMPDLLRVQQSEQLQPGGYVRIKRGKYQGDLAQIDDVETNGLEATLRIVPRLDYGLNEDMNAPVGEALGPGGKRKRPGTFGAKAGSRPPPRLFSESEARKKHSKLLQTMSTFDKKQWTYDKETYVNGYLIKDYKIQHLQTQNVNPTLEEVTRFAAGSEDGTENLDLSALAANLKNQTSADSYLPGDTVEVYEGEQQGITGKASSVRGDIVTLTVTEGELKGRTLDVPMKGLRKRFREGDHVKIIGGSRFRDEVGMVVRIKDDKVTLVSDLTMQEITVFSKDLREASDTGAAGGLGLYDIHDMVQLDAATVGCVTKVDRESLRILDQNGTIRTTMPSQISNKIDRRRHAVATDRNGAEIRQDDTVKEVGGENRQGTILHIHRAFLFCHNREQPEHSGLFVVRASNVATVAAKGGRVASQAPQGPDLSKMNPAMQRQNGRNGQNGSMPPPKTFGRDPTIGKTVNIRKGPFKGLLGIVRDTTDNEARIELHTKNKIIQVSKDSLGFKDPISGATMSFSEFSSRGRGRGMPSGMPGGGATPMRSGGYGGATPSRDGWAGGGGQTPMGGRDGGRTPAWGMAGGRTPAWGGGGGGGGGSDRSGGDAYSRNSSSRTPAWSGGGGSSNASGGFGSGGRTPAWSGGGATAYGGATTYNSNSGGRTPAWGDSGSRTAYGEPTSGFGGSNSSGFGGYGGGNAGSRTPAYNPDSGSRTPAYGRDAPTPAADPWARASDDAPTPAASAPTPAAWKDAPTPRDAPTPAAYPSRYALDAPTPAAGAPTPFAGGPETPAAWGGADDDEDTGPRYVDDEDDD